VARKHMSCSSCYLQYVTGAPAPVKAQRTLFARSIGEPACAACGIFLYGPRDNDFCCSFLGSANCMMRMAKSQQRLQIQPSIFVVGHEGRTRVGCRTRLVFWHMDTRFCMELITWTRLHVCVRGTPGLAARVATSDPCGHTYMATAMARYAM
jgi:hypothetical protein